MLSDDFLYREKQNLIALGDKLQGEVNFARGYINSKRPDNEKRWMNSVLSHSTYGTFLIKNLLNSLDTYKDKPEAQISLYIGKVAIQSFLEIINAFEKSINDLVCQSSHLSDMLQTRIDKKIQIIETSWDKKSTGKSRKLKLNIIRTKNSKIREMQFIRETLYLNGVIDDLDRKVLDFAWNVRNSMHTDFLAIKDIKFFAPGTSLNYSFDFKKGEELYHSSDLLSFYSMTEQIIFIQIKILQRINQISKD
jgi:hypothetical protein